METPKALFVNGIDAVTSQIVAQLDMSEQLGAPGANGELTPFLLIESDVSGVTAHRGVCRVFKSPTYGRLISLKLYAEDSSWSVQMVCFLTDWDSVIPHFYIDCVYVNPSGTHGEPNGDHTDNSYFHLTIDYLPKLDLVANPEYTKFIYHPVSRVIQAVHRNEKCQEHSLATKQTACMSPWHTAIHLSANQGGIDVGNSILSSYFQEWAAYFPEESHSPTAKKIIPSELIKFEKNKMMARDRRHRAAFFNSDVHPVWFRVESMLGKDSFSQFSQLFKPVEI